MTPPTKKTAPVGAEPSAKELAANLRAWRDRCLINGDGYPKPPKEADFEEFNDILYSIEDLEASEGRLKAAVEQLPRYDGLGAETVKGERGAYFFAEDVLKLITESEEGRGKE